ncbi:MAG: hypothetical protein M1837_005460 [Sclerophora amabilis]|nr:MAG: hypothetical protein M1837_005460 [Sclerophora amabilis]
MLIVNRFAAQQFQSLNSPCLLRVPQRKSSRLFSTTHYNFHASQSPSGPLKFANIADDEISRLAAKPLHPLILADLVRHGRPPLSADALFSSANFTLSLLPIRLAHRLQSLRNLPYIVVSNPHISQIYSNYLHSLSTLLPYTERRISTLQDESTFTEVMADLVQTHANTIPILARGFLECRKYISPAEVTRFLDEHLRARIGTRLIAEQHIALHFSSLPHRTPETMRQHPSSDSYVGVIDTALKPATVIHSCASFVSEICELKYGVRPSIVIDGQPDTTFTHVPVHLEYIVTELLKNAFRAVVETGKEREPVVITIAAAPAEQITAEGKNTLASSDQGDVHAPPPPPSSSSANETPTNGGIIRQLDDCVPGVTIRFRDRGGGISPDHLPNIWSYSFTTFSDEERSFSVGGSDAGIGASAGPGSFSNNGTMDALNAISGSATGESSIAGLGYGLPLGRAYAEYFGGGVAVQSMWGWGTDVYLSLRGVGKID